MIITNRLIMVNTTVFSNVSADVAMDFKQLFPDDFDFNVILTKICEDAGVNVHCENAADGVCYKLQGLWHPIEEARKLLITMVIQHGVGQLMDRTDSAVPAPYTDCTPEIQPHPKQLIDGCGDKGRLQRGTPSELCSDGQDRRPVRTPSIDHTVSCPQQNSVMQLSNNADIVSRPTRASGETPSRHRVGKDGSVVSKQKSKRTSCKKKQTANCVRPRMVNVCREENGEHATCDTDTDLVCVTDNKQHDSQSNANRKSSLHKENNAHPDSSTSDNMSEKKMLNTSLGAIENKCHQQHKKNKGKKSHKAVPEQLSDASPPRPFLSKSKSQSNCSLLRSTHERKAHSPVSTKSAVKRKQRLAQKDEGVTYTKFSCSECKFVTVSRSRLMGHVHRQHQGNLASCDLCGKVFCDKTNMLRHRSSHTGPQHCCDVCGKMFKIQKAMMNHRKTHDEGYTGPIFPCKLCEKTFCSQYIMDCHVRSFHLGQRKNYLCSFCGKKFTTKHSLQEHANAHTGIKPHACEICGKRFSYDSALRDHKFIHDDVKQFSCQVCDKTFCQRSGLKMHMRIHKDVKQFQCQECGREFTQKQALQRHERVHKGVKPFSCRLCSRSFSDASIIRRHLTLVHKIHKDAKTWREDIICTVQPDLEYHVSYVGVTESNDHQPIKAHEKGVHTEAKNRAQRGKYSGKRNAQKESTAGNTGVSHEPLQSASGPNGDVHEGGDSLSSLGSCNNGLQSLSLSERMYSQDSSQNHQIDKHALHSMSDLPQAPDPAGAQSQDPDLSPAALSATHSHSHIPLMTSQTAGQQRRLFSTVCCSTLGEAASLSSTNKSTDPVVTTAAHNTTLLETSTVGENVSRPHCDGPQSSSPTSKESCTVAIVPGATTVSNTPISVQQPWPSFYYYTQLANQFGMTLSDYSYVAGSSQAGINTGPLSPGLEQPSCCPRLQSDAQGVDHSSPFLPRQQGTSLSSGDFVQRHDSRDVRDTFSDGHGFMLTSPGVDSSRSDLSLDGGENVQDRGVSREAASVLPSLSVVQRVGEKTFDSNLA